MNSDNASNTANSQSVPLPERMPRNELDKEKTKFSKDQEFSSQSKDISEKTQLSKDNPINETAKEQRNINSPFIVEELSHNLSSLSIPQSLKHCRAKPERNISQSTISFRDDLSIKEDNACVIVAQSINPNDTSSIEQTNRDNEKTPVKQNNATKPQKFRSNLKSTNDKAFKNTKQDDDTTEMETEVSDGITKTWSQCSQYLKFYCLKSKVLVVMGENSRFCFTGKLSIKVLYGEVEVYGYVISPSIPPLEVYSPRGYSSVPIRTSNNISRYNILDTWAMLAAEGITRDVKSTLQTDVDGCKPGMAVVMLKNFENKLTEFLSNFYPHRLFPDIKNVSRYSWTDPRRAEITLQSNIHLDSHTCKMLIMNPSTLSNFREKILNRFRSNQRTCTLIAGGKGTGKSTGTRYLINTLLSEVKGIVLLDIDPGQTECTPPGCISYSLIEEPLLGPNFTHLKTPVYQVYIGGVDVMQCLTRYITGVKTLVNKLFNNPTLSRLPIVVNTMGFIHGIGWHIIVFLIRLIRPTLIIQLISERPRNNFVNLLSEEIINKQVKRFFLQEHRPCCHELSVLNSETECKTETESWTMKSSEKRELVLISYLSSIVQYERCLTSNRALSLTVNTAIPYTIPFSCLTVSLPQTEVSPSHVLSVVNGNIVALCGMNFTDRESSNGRLRVLRHFPLPNCYGFGIVRGVDMEKEEVFINTPLPLSTMQYVNCLVGCIPVPLTVLQLNKPGVPYAGGNDALPTSRESRRGYFRMRYQNKKR